MPYRLKVFLYLATWCVVGFVIGWRLLGDANLFTIFGISILMALAIILIGRRLFGRQGFWGPELK